MQSEKKLLVLSGWRGKLMSLTMCALFWAGCGPSLEGDGSATGDQQEHPSSDHHEHDQQRFAVTINNPAPDAYSKGQFSAVQNQWPIIPIATMVQPDGKVFAYGTNKAPLTQGADTWYTIWDPVADTFITKGNETHSDTFCSGQALIPVSGDTLMVGGDISINGVINNGISDVNVLVNSDVDGGVIKSDDSMKSKRWYPTLVTLPSGAHVVLGGLDAQSYAGGERSFSPIPEVRAANGTWRQLTNASSDEAYGALGTASWNYPRAWVNPQGKVFVINSDGYMFELNTAAPGTLTQYKDTNGIDFLKAKGGGANLTAVMFQPGRILLARNEQEAIIVDINNLTPVVTAAGKLKYDRRFGNSTVLADGKVFFNGGSPNKNEGGREVFESEMYDPFVPAAQAWKVMASAQRPRLYHSTSMLLPDGTVFTGGGGAPGPTDEKNAEIYFPPYLFKQDGATSQLVTDRPTVTAPVKVTWKEEFTVNSNKPIKKVTLVRIGGTTHNYNNETRFYTLYNSLTAVKPVTAFAPKSANVAPPGFYMLFVWDADGVPSMAKIMRID